MDICYCEHEEGEHSRGPLAECQVEGCACACYERVPAEG